MKNLKHAKTPIWGRLLNPHLPFPAPCSLLTLLSRASAPPPGVAGAPCLPTRWRPPCTWRQLPCPCSSSSPPRSRCSTPSRSCPPFPCAISSRTHAPACCICQLAHAQPDAFHLPSQTLNKPPSAFPGPNAYDLPPTYPIHAIPLKMFLSLSFILYWNLSSLSEQHASALRVGGSCMCLCLCLCICLHCLINPHLSPELAPASSAPICYKLSICRCCP